MLVLILASSAWLAVSVPYQVKADERGVQLLFGRYVSQTGPGLNFWFPWPIGSVIKPQVTRVNRIDIGFQERSQHARSDADPRRS